MTLCTPSCKSISPGCFFYVFLLMVRNSTFVKKCIFYDSFFGCYFDMVWISPSIQNVAYRQLYRTGAGTTVAGDSIGNNSSGSPHAMGTRVRNVFFLSPLVLSKFLNDKINNYVKQNMILNFIIQKLKI